MCTKEGLTVVPFKIALIYWVEAMYQGSPGGSEADLEGLVLLPAGFQGTQTIGQAWQQVHQPSLFMRFVFL